MLNTHLGASYCKVVRRIVRVIIVIPYSVVYSAYFQVKSDKDKNNSH